MSFKPGDNNYKLAFGALAMALAAACTSAPAYQSGNTPDESFAQDVRAQDREATDLRSDALEQGFDPAGQRAQ